ncbi:LegC family aminotransferase [Clostridium aminobutyricum]|uniref:LegC family aminotransferase n=1 Tax=Clostridium aminobutyricum TaxID=33953 RepID=A0A939IJZ1_CLOAM|nr:LegC family aminotransferase [Clostridium aminobutyricum]MBN7774059.1 LegC family aminotransferase [Clostridium aminobutyricum]
MEKKQIQLSVPNLNMDIVDNLRECIETGWISTGGRFITEFEQKIAKYVGLKDAVSAQSGTAGLHVALRILGVKSGEEVIVPTLTFVAAVNPVKYLGAEPIFMDCDDSLCMDAVKLEKFCREECELDEKGLVNKKTGKRVAVIIVVHIFGNLAKMEQVMDIAAKYRLKVLEDATEALGSYYTTGRYAGKFSGTISDMGVYSFNANKIITTGGGGMIVSNNQDYLDQARYLTITAKNTTPEDALYFVHGEVGYNYRMLNLQAALGVSQMDQLESFIQTKMSNYELYKKELSDVNGITILPFESGIRANHWFYSLYIDENGFGESRDDLMHRLIDRGIQCRPIWKLIHILDPYKDAQSYQVEKAIDYADHILNVPCSTNLSAEDVKYVCEQIKLR